MCQCVYVYGCVVVTLVGWCVFVRASMCVCVSCERERGFERDMCILGERREGGKIKGIFGRIMKI